MHMTPLGILPTMQLFMPASCAALLKLIDTDSGKGTAVFRLIPDFKVSYECRSFGVLFLHIDDLCTSAATQNALHHGASPTQSYPHQAPSQTSREAYFSPPAHVQQQQPPTQPAQQSGYYSQELALRNGVGSNANNGGGNDGSMQYYNQNGYYFVNNGMHATEQDQSYYKNMFIELGFGEPNPPGPQHVHQAPIAYSHHMQHANYGH
jgi:hypothetical protein